MTIGEKIKTARLAQGKTQQEVSNLSSVSRVTIAQIEADRIEGRFGTIVYIARALGIDPRELFDLVPMPFLWLREF